MDEIQNERSVLGVKRIGKNRRIIFDVCKVENIG